MGHADQLHRERLVLDVGQRDRELDGEREVATLAEQADPRANGDVAQVDPAPARDGPERAVEARAEADREQLLGVGAPALASQPGRGAERDVQGTVGGAARPAVRPPLTSASAV